MSGLVGKASGSNFPQLANTFGITWADANEPTQERSFQAVYDACLKACQDDDWGKIETCQVDLASLTDSVGPTVLVTAVHKKDCALFEGLLQRNIALESSKGLESALRHCFPRTKGGVALLHRLWNQIDFENPQNWRAANLKAKALSELSLSLLDTSNCPENKKQHKTINTIGAFVRKPCHTIGCNMDPEDKVKLYLHLGSTRLVQGKPKQAQQFFQKVSAIVCENRSFFGNNPSWLENLDKMAILEKMGICLLALGKTEEALKEFISVLVTHQESLEANDPVILKTLDHIGHCLLTQGKTEEALKKFKSVLMLRQESLDPEHPDIATSLNNIGRCLSAQAKVKNDFTHFYENFEEVLALRKKALAKHKQALVIQEKTLSADHPDIATSHYEIGICLYMQSKHKEALAEHEKALALRKKSLAPKHPDIARSLYEVGKCCLQCNRYDEANKCFKQAYEIASESIGDNHPTTRLFWEKLQERKKLQRPIRF